jgi:hypothetical protein
MSSAYTTIEILGLILCETLTDDWGSLDLGIEQDIVNAVRVQLR